MSWRGKTLQGTFNYKKMPSIKNNPPKKTIEVKILKGCIANGERTKAGSIITVAPNSADLLIYSKLAILTEDIPKKKTSKKVAKAKPPVDAER